MEIIFLGVGSSTGTPVIGCNCATCTSTDPRNNRTRCSIAVRTDNNAMLLIDTGPDLRLQALRENIPRVDAVLYTHAHADHVHGLDDLRNFCHLQKQVIPIFGNEPTISSIRERFDYAFTHAGPHWDKPKLSAHFATRSFEIGGTAITPVPLLHGSQEILGYRINNIAYLTDVSTIPETSFPLLQNLELLILDCLRYRPHHTHIHFEKAVEYAQKIAAKKTYLIHMTHEAEYNDMASKLPEAIYVAHDGLRLTIRQ
jgi:phosphoribosyl 1,2-cyclic phosphate phosphodiesterase